MVLSLREKGKPYITCWQSRLQVEHKSSWCYPHLVREDFVHCYTTQARFSNLVSTSSPFHCLNTRFLCRETCWNQNCISSRILNSMTDIQNYRPLKQKTWDRCKSCKFWQSRCLSAHFAGISRDQTAIWWTGPEPGTVWWIWSEHRQTNCFSDYCPPSVL